MTTALLLVDHGSRRASANENLSHVAPIARERLGEGAIVEVAHMELAEPTIAQAFDACVAAGAKEVVVFPWFLAAGRHAREDIPRLVTEAAEKHPGVTHRVAEPFGPHPLLVEAALTLAELK
jgi:sirohydrochlorin ferrochelatase